MHTMSKEVATFGSLLAPRREFTNRVHLLLMAGGTLVMLLALLSDMQPRLTCVASLWSVAGLYGLSQLLRPDSQEPAAVIDLTDAENEAELVEI